MSKRLQIFLSEEAETKLNKIYANCTEGFNCGTIKISDLVSEMILSSDVDIKELRLKYTDLKKSLLELAHSDDLDIELALKTISELKQKASRKTSKSAPKQTEILL